MFEGDDFFAVFSFSRPETITWSSGDTSLGDSSCSSRPDSQFWSDSSVIDEGVSSELSTPGGSEVEARRVE